MSAQIERHADQGEAAIRAGTPDFGLNGTDQDGVLTDASDAIASILHAVHRYGLEAHHVVERACRAYDAEVAEEGHPQAPRIPSAGLYLETPDQEGAT